MQSQTLKPILITAIPAFTDNYFWAITSHEVNVTDNKTLKPIALVDPGDAKPCITYLEENNLQLCAILITHHHADHTGGVAELKSYCKNKNWPLTVYAPENEKITNVDVRVVAKQIIDIPALETSFEVIDLAGHTLDHIGYYTGDAVFCGDTLFSGGCGRIFEGSPKQMLSALTRLTDLPDRTHVYCAHEYTLANLKFALAVEPNNAELVHYYNQVVERRAKNIPTIPSSILLEKKINPFLRCQQQEIIESAVDYSGKNSINTLATFTVIRQWKNEF
ncbi:MULTISPECIES: hydroxyacylglutathione hydrolase [unclassified Colwellia]|uniref:hydroxyacylglutathione hydrolase n=1 Tax=unclassified Colwellia TaxID=196834 RepID=UPI002872EF5E|nr:MULTISPECIES: hydroxyacylglutathione hydrolase [unclassified Colwellia]